MVQRHPSQVSPGSSVRSFGYRYPDSSRRFFSGAGAFGHPGSCPYPCGHPHEQWSPYPATQLEPFGFERARGETGGFMLSVTGLNRFYFLRGFHDMRCKYERVLSIIHQQLNREPEEGDVFIVLSKDQRKVRLFSYDRRSYSLFEKRFAAGYRFMKVVHEGDDFIYSIDWKDVVLLLESPVVKKLNIR